MSGPRGDREELVRGLHHPGAAGYRARTGDPGWHAVSWSARAVGRRFPDAAPLIDLVARN